MNALEAQEEALHADSSGVVPERAIRGENTVARDDDGNGVRGHHLPDRAGSSRLSDLLGQLAVGEGLTETGVHESPQDALLEGARRAWVHRDLEAFPGTIEVAIELVPNVLPGPSFRQVRTAELTPKSA